MAAIIKLLKDEAKDFFQLKNKSRSILLPLLPALSIGLPLFIGLYLESVHTALLAALGGLVSIYYQPATAFPIRMMQLFINSFGLIIAFGIGLFFSFNYILSAISLGLLAICSHWITIYFKSKPPGSFFFIMIAAMGCYLPHDLALIPFRIGMLAFGTMGACLIAFVFGLLTFKKETGAKVEYSLKLEKNRMISLFESLVIGVCMFSALYLGHLLKFDNPYWLPISCLAVMQGISRYHIWRRVYHRILGTLVGVGLCWVLLSFLHSSIWICVAIFVLQFLVELIITRHYALAVVFITPMTILLAEVGNPILFDRDALIMARLLDIIVGSGVGAIGGWLIYTQWVRVNAVKQIRKTNHLIRRKIS